MDNMYKKNKAYADAEGVKFQLDLVTVAALNGLLYLENWKVSSENKRAGKFDDVVIELPDGVAVLIQAKHKKNGIISKNKFLSTKRNADFGLPKYFFSYEAIKSKLGKKTVVICTNASIDKEGLDDVLNVHCVSSDNVLQCEDSSYSSYTLKDNILSDLKESVETYFENHLKNKYIDKTLITDKKLKAFLENLQIFSNYPSGGHLQKIIEKLLSRLNIVNLQSNNISYYDIYRKMEDWLKQPVGEFLTKTRAKAMICEIRCDKYCEMLKNYNISFELDDFNLIESKQVFHIPTEHGYLMQMLKVYHALQDHKGKKLFINPDESTETQREIIEAFGQRQYKFLIVKVAEANIKEIRIKLRVILEAMQYKKIILMSENNKLVEQTGLTDITQINGSVQFEDLSSSTQEKLLKNKIIIFQDKRVNLQQLLQTQGTEVYTESLHSGMLEKLVRGEEVKVGRHLLSLDEEISRYYIPRTFERKNESSRGEDPIPQDRIFDVTEKVVLISDSAGLGKSTVMTKIAAYVKEKYSHLWVIRINLTDYTRILREHLMKNINTISVIDLLNSKKTTAMINQFETLVFSMERKVALLLDGVDEISPDYTGLIFDLISQCQKASNFAKIFITTRPHVSLELQASLEIKSFKMLPFTRPDQVNFLVKYWIHNLQLTGTNEKKCTQYAETLIDKMSSWIKSYHYWENTFTAVPLQVRMLAEIFQYNNMWSHSTDWEGCKEYLERDDAEPKLPETFNIASLYGTFIQKKRDLFLSKENPSGNAATNTALMNQFEDCLFHHHSFALRVILDKNETELFTNCYPKNHDVKEYVLKIGIVQRLGEEFQFIHRTFAEFFVAESIARELILQNSHVEFQRFLIEDVLVHGRFEVVCAFLDILLQTVSLPSDTFKNYRSSACQTNWNLIFQLARKGYVAILQLILRSINFKIIRGKEINIKDWPFKLTFHKRNTLNDLKVLTRIAGINIRNGHGETPLHAAVRRDHLEMVDFLVEQGANIDIRDNTGRTALHLAVECNNLKTVKYLVHRNANVNNSDKDGLTALHLASECHRSDPVECLIENGADANVRDNEGRTALHLAVKYNRLDSAKYLVLRGADVNVRDNEGLTALHLSVKYYRISPDLVEYLTEQGADVNVQDAAGCTALYLAVKYDHFNLVKYLAKHRADVNVSDNTGRTALHLAIYRDRLRTAKYLVKYGADINIRDGKGRTVLHLASETHRLDAVKYLVGRGGDVNDRDDEGRSTLYAAIKYNRLNVIKYLLEKGADINSKDNSSCTALHWAVEFGRMDILRYLVEQGADIYKRDREGRTALYLAIRKSRLNMVQYFKEIGVPDNSTVSDSYWRKLFKS